MFIVFEGIDGSGKSTQVNRLAEWLREQGREVVTSFEPTRGRWGKILRESGTSGRRTGEEEFQLFLLDRREHVDTLIHPTLERGGVVILDRYYFSTMAYQGCRGLDIEEIRRRNEEFAPIPDYLFILDLDVDTALQRIKRRDPVTNEFEKRDGLECCRKIFLSLKDEPFAHVFDAAETQEKIQQKIREKIML